MNVSHSGTSDKERLHRPQMRVFALIDARHVVELEIEELVDQLKSSLDLNVVLEFDGNLLIHKRFEKRKEQHLARLVEDFR